MSLIPLGFWAASGGGISYWISTLGSTGADRSYSVAIDSSDNLYSFGWTYSVGAGADDFLLYKYDTAGAIQWQRTLGGVSGDRGEAVAIDSADNVYAIGRTNTTGAGGYDFLLAKYNSAGTIQWQRVLGGTGNDYGFSVAIDSADNVYFLGYTSSAGAGAADVLLAKYNSAGTIQWQRILGGTNQDFGHYVAIDSSDNVYLVGETASTGAGVQDFLLSKYNSSGTIQWQRTLGGATNDYGHSLAIDSSDNVYFVGYEDSTGAGGVDFLVAKYNSSGTILWQRALGGSSDDMAKSVAIDSSDNVYLVGKTDSASASSDLLLAKYNSDGAIQFQRILSGSGFDTAESVKIDSLGAVCVSGWTNSTSGGSQFALLAKLPNDGSLTGTYVLDGVNLTYSSSSLTPSTPTLTSATSSLTSATSSLTSATSSLTDATASLTPYLVKI